MHLYLGVTFIVLALSATSGTAQRCLETRTSAFDLSVKAQRNESGHLITWVDTAATDTVGFPQLRKKRHVTLDLGYEVFACGSNETVILSAKTVVSPTSNFVPPHGYEAIHGVGYYRFYSAALPWAKARSKCVEDGAHLIVINSDMEADVIRTFFKRNPVITNAAGVVDVHVGFHDLFVEGEYTTVLGYPLSSAGYSKWAATQPNGGSENCGAATNTGLLHDIPCSWKLAYICEANIQ
ncbi:hemolymph lipopolysaccharide-binding protein [Anabrus simplex]|uniref:hemolymph lipopolysaccharide-binding protein n=1 Tax=Anabrus simplex TaxID=316456 RepID=UPI0035A3C246